MMLRASGALGSTRPIRRGWGSVFLFLLATSPGLAALPLLLDGALVGPDIVAVGERGVIVRSSDSARTWEKVPAPTRATLTGVNFAPAAAPVIGWAVGHDALILATSDGGRTWSKQYQGEDLQESFLDVLALDAQRAIAVGAYGLFVQTADGGKTWIRRRLGDEDYHFNRISRGPAGTLYLAGEHGRLLRSGDSGATWTRIAAPYDGSFYGILPLDERTLLAHGLRGRVFRSEDDGATWSPVATPEPALLASAVRLKNNTLLLGGQARVLLVSRDGGRTTAAIPDSLPAAFAELLELHDGNLLALGEAGATVIVPPR
jgi:photosystem II stability/assembly factor-like uncharacterized protein